jgi:hypothetical protein
MSLQQPLRNHRDVIDLTDGPVIDLTTASFYSSGRAELEEAANRLVMSAALPRPATGYATPYAAGRVTVAAQVRRASAPRIDVSAILGVSAVAAVALLLLGLATTVLS